MSSASTRLFVGGLSQQLPEEELNQQLSNFGTVKKLEIKEKKDLCTGEVLKRFAFATLDAPSSRIDQCIRSLHGKSLHGSELTLERAQESFIDRLNREREARAQGKTIDKTSYNGNNNQQNNQIDSYQFNFGGSDVADTRNSHYEEDYSRQRPPQGGTDDTSRFGGQKRGRAWEDEDKHKVPEELFPSSVWREDGEDRREGEKEGDRPHQGDDRRSEDDSRYRKASPPPPKWAKMAPRYDPKKKSSMTAAMTDTRQSEEIAEQLPKPAIVPTTVSADLTFTGSAQGFSLLSMLEQAEPVTIVAKDAAEGTYVTATPKDDDQQQRDVRPPVEDQVSVAEKKQPTPVKTYIKKFKFFVDLDDPEVEENLRWVYQEIPNAQLTKFNVDRPEIVKLYTDWHRKAFIEKRKYTSRAGSDTSGHKHSGATSAVFEGDGEAAVMAAANDGIGLKPVALSTDTLIGAVQTVEPTEEAIDDREGGARRGGGGWRGKNRGRGRRPPASGGGERRQHGKTYGREGRGRCPG